MAKAAKFPMQLCFSATEAMADAIARVADVSEKTESAVIREGED